MESEVLSLELFLYLEESCLKYANGHHVVRIHHEVGLGQKKRIAQQEVPFLGNFDKEITKRCFPGLLCGSDKLGKHNKPQNIKDKGTT